MAALSGRPFSSVRPAGSLSVEAAGGMGEHGIDLARVRGQVALGHRFVAVGARNIGEQFLEVGDVAIDGGAELRLAFVFPLDLVESLLAFQRVEATGEEIGRASCRARVCQYV